MLYDIERQKSSRATEMPKMHVHDCNELYFLISGQRRYFIGHTIYDVFPGNLVIIPKNELHKTASQLRTGFDRYLLSFYDESVNGLTDIIGKHEYSKLMQAGCIQFPPDIAKEVQAEFEAALREMTDKPRYYEVYANAHLQSILTAVLRHGERKQNVTGQSADKIQEIARFISENYASDLTLSDAAAMAYMEGTYFSKRFKKLTGSGFNEYLTSTRLRAAERLLCTTQLSIGDIADRCGFSGANYFGDVFKRQHGISPKEYRKTKPLLKK